MWICFFLVSGMSCTKNKKEDKVKVNFSHKEPFFRLKGSLNSPIKAAVSAMISPEETLFYYSRVFDYISSKLGRKIIFKQRKTYHEVNELLRNRELDFAFICSGAYVEAEEDFGAKILAVPQIRGKTYYHAYIIVHKDSSVENFEELRNHSFAFTDPLSNTGCLYPRYLVKRMNQTEEEFFSSVIYTYAHDYSIQAVAKKLVDGASVDSLIYDYMKKTQPQKLAPLKIIKRSVPFGIPPVVAHPKLAPPLFEELQSVLLNMDADSEGKEILAHLAVDRFVLGQDKDYDSIRAMRTLLHEQKR